MSRRPPARIETDRLVLRCWEVADAEALAEAVAPSLDHLRAWMPWAADEPISLEARRRLLSSFRREFRGGTNFVYGIFELSTGEVVGGTGLHRRRGPGDLEIGYWIRADRLRRGYATEATAVLTRIAFEVVGVDRLVILVDPRNAASLGVPRKLGFTEGQTLDGALLPLPADPESRAGTVFSLERADHPTDAVAAFPFSL